MGKLEEQDRELWLTEEERELYRINWRPTAPIPRCGPCETNTLRWRAFVSSKGGLFYTKSMQPVPAYASEV
jgi:hypothetical protein